MDITRQPPDRWIIDFGWKMSETEAALYEAPFAYVLRKSSFRCVANPVGGVASLLVDASERAPGM